MKIVPIKSLAVIRRCYSAFDSKNRRKLNGFIFLQGLTSILDLIGVAFLGLIGTLAINGINGIDPSSRVVSILKIIRISEWAFQTQVAFLALLATSALILKTLVTLQVSRRLLFFLSELGSNLSSALTLNLFSRNLLKVQGDQTQKSLYLLSVGTEAVTIRVLGTVVLICSDLILMFVLCAGIFMVNFKLATIVIVLFGSVAYLLFRGVQSRVTAWGKLSNTLAIELNETYLKGTEQYRDMYVRNLQSDFTTSIAQTKLRMNETAAKLAFIPNLGKYVLEISLVIGLLVMSAFVFATENATRGAATLSIFIAAASRIAPGVLRIQQGAFLLRQNIEVANDTLNLLEATKHEMLDDKILVDQSCPDLNFSPEVKLEDVSFCYPGKSKAAISHVNMEIHPGEHVAIVGPTGSGKTTLVDLILGLITPDTGIVSIASQIPSNAIRMFPGKISYLPQNFMITAGTVRTNVTFDKPLKYSDDEIWRALELAKLDLEFRKLPLGLETVIDERGSNLSGGQRQRLGLARTLLSSPQLIVLDEATSSLDAETELQVASTVNSLKGKITVISIAHRLTTIESADTVFYLDGGKILASGSFGDVKNAIPNFDTQNSKAPA